MGILCSLKNINLSFGTKAIFSSAELTIHKHDKIGLIGLNGKGKSSLFKILSEELVPDTSTPAFQFNKGRGDNDEGLRFTVFHVPQELPLEEGDEITIKNYLFRFYPEHARIHNRLDEINHLLEAGKGNIDKVVEEQKNLLEKFEHLDGWNLINSYQSYLKYFELEDFDKPVTSLSGGEQKKILLSLGLSSKANLILWDEPTNHLDIETIKLFEEELESSNSTYVLVSHDRYLLARATNKIFHINRASVQKFDGSYSDYLEHLAIKEEERKRLLAKLKNTLRRETEWMRQGIKARGCRSKKRVENFHELSKSVANVKAQAKREIELSIDHSYRKTKELINFDTVNFSYEDKEIFNALTMSICKGNKIGLLGPNGAGKTTLVNLIADKLSATSGKVKRADDLVVQHFSQKREELDANKTPFELLGEGEDFVHLPGGRSIHVASYFESFLFESGDLKRPVHTLSGGERNRLQLAINLKQAGDLLIFDEPTNDLDLETLQILETKLAEFDGSVIIISHDRAFLSSVTNKIWLIEDKKLENFEGGYSQVASYLDATMMENMLKKSGQEEAPTVTKEVTPTPSTEKRRLTNKEKERLKRLPEEISKLEKQVETIQTQVDGFDFSTMSQDKSEEYQELTGKQEELEMGLLEAYEELEKLESLL